MEKVTTAQLLSMFKSKKYSLEENPYYPNLFGIRKETNVPNEFDDFVGAIWKDRIGTWYSCCYAATTDPGKYWLVNPMNVDGAAIIVPGQYKKAYKVGYHKDYEAYKQIRPMSYVRDGNRDGLLDWLYRTIGFKTYKEVAATNIHRANKDTTSKIVEKWSAGCQVLANPHEFTAILELGKNYIVTGKNLNEFNYTLFEEKDIVK